MRVHADERGALRHTATPAIVAAPGAFDGSSLDGRAMKNILRAALYAYALRIVIPWMIGSRIYRLYGESRHVRGPLIIYLSALRCAHAQMAGLFR